MTAARELRATGKRPRRRAAWVMKNRMMPSDTYEIEETIAAKVRLTNNEDEQTRKHHYDAEWSRKPL